jgi:hypothetical protein
MIKLPKALQERLANEFRFAANKMLESPDLVTKLYFFSVFFGELNRAFNQLWDSDLGLTHLVLRDVHERINGRVNVPAVGTRIPDELPGALDQLANDLAALFETKQIDDAQLHQLLARAAELGYVVTGNGYYLYLKGEIRL